MLEIIGYGVEASDGPLGQVDDFVLSEDSWRVQFLVVDTSSWLLGRRVVVPPAKISKVDWTSRTARIDLTQQQIRGSAELRRGVPRLLSDPIPLEVQ
jgi:hypothetical protein